MLVNVCGPLPAINMARKHTMGCKKRVNICEKQKTTTTKKYYKTRLEFECYKSSNKYVHIKAIYICGSCNRL